MYPKIETAEQRAELAAQLAYEIRHFTETYARMDERALNANVVRSEYSLVHPR